MGHDTNHPREDEQDEEEQFLCAIVEMMRAGRISTAKLHLRAYIDHVRPEQTREILRMGQTEQELIAKFSDLAVELEKHSNDHIHDALPDNLGAAVEGVCADRINAILKPYRSPVETSDVPHAYEGIELGLDKCKRCGKSRDAHVAGTGKICRCDCVNCVTGNHHQCYYRPEPICCTLDAPVAASPSAGAQEGEHVVSHYEPWGVMPANKLSATSLSAGDNESYTGPKGSLTKINWQKIAEDRAVEIASLRAAASPDVLARIEGLIAKWREPHGMCQVYYDTCADELAALRDELSKERL